jgi:hypothetical protein
MSSSTLPPNRRCGGHRSGLADDDDDDGIQQLVRLPQRQLDSSHNDVVVSRKYNSANASSTASSPRRAPVAASMATIPASVGGPEFLVAETESNQRHASTDHNDEEIKKRVHAGRGAVNPGALAMQRQRLELAPAVERVEAPPGSTQVVSLLTDEEVKATAIATSRAQPSNGKDHEARHTPTSSEASRSEPNGAGDSLIYVESQQVISALPSPDPGTSHFASHGTSERASLNESSADVDVDVGASVTHASNEREENANVLVEALADRIAKRFRAQMEERHDDQVQAQQRTDISQQRQTYQPIVAPVIAIKVEDVETGFRGNGNRSEERGFCGIKKISTLWTTAAVAVVIICVVVGVLLASGDDGKGNVVASAGPPIASTPSPTAPPTEPPTPRAPPESPRFEALMDLIGADIAVDPSGLRNRDTVQYWALEWLANVDPAQLDVTGSIGNNNLIERYVILVLVLQSQQATLQSLQSTLGFMSTLPVCGWHDDEEVNGIKCNGDGVSHILLRTYTFLFFMSICYSPSPSLKGLFLIFNFFKQCQPNPVWKA